MDCMDVLAQIGDYLDRDAQEELCKVIEQHLSNCRDCKFEYDTVRHTILLYHEADRAQRLEIPVRVNQQLTAALAAEYSRAAPGKPRSGD